MDIAKELSKSLSERIVIAKVCVYRALDSRLLNQLAPIKVDDELWDLERPLEKSVKLELLDFEHPEGVYLSCVQIVSGH